MSPDITELDADTRDRIAAGEVVERPASVVKELVENALDADASRVTVRVEAGGKRRVVVADDGVGMTDSEARKAIREHTTSKLTSLADLESIGTLGFRGEALHAIGAVSRLEIRTKPRGGTDGAKLVVDGGDLLESGPVGCPEGTTVEVTDLFGNVPARRKYLKTDATEFDHVQRVVAGYALANPGVAVTLERDGREAFSTVGDGDRRSAVMAVYGREVAASMISVESAATSEPDAAGGTPSDGSDADEGTAVGVEGLVSHPETNRAGPEYVTTLVDGRYVTSSVVRDAVVDAYGTQLAPDRYPFAVLDVEVPAGGVDVNVHPRKLEVLFADAGAVRDSVASAVESALLEEGLLRSRAPRGRSAPEQTEISSDDAGPAGDGRTRPETEGGSEPAASSGGSAGGEVDFDADTTPREAAERPNRQPDAADGGDGTASSRTDARDGHGAASSAPEAAGERDDGREQSSRVDRSFRATPTQRTLDGEETAGTPADLERLPSMTVLGQFDETYVVAETEDGLLLVDQHAADERVHYERFRESFSGDVTTQALADPVELELTAREVALVESHGEALSRLGFRVQCPDERAVRVTTVPALVAERVGGEAPELVRDLLSEFVGGDPSGTVESVVDALLGDLACHPAVTGNTSLTEGTVAELLAALDDCGNPYACPHGRPTVIELSREEITDRFERDYPGHGGRRE